MTQKFYMLVTHSIIIFITLSTELTRLPALSHGNLAVETLSKIVSSIQDSANAVSANTFQ